MKNFGLYLVMTDPLVGYAKCAEAAVKAGVRIVQLRMKKASCEEILRQGREVRSVTAGTDTLFIVNDDPEIALELGADGVHVGQDDVSPREIRKRFPEIGIIGLSTHNLKQVEKAREEKIDYIGVGPVYATSTKEIPDPTLGLDKMRAMIELSPCPAVAIGGINCQNARDVVGAGAKNIAVVRAVCQSNEPYWEIVKLKQEFLQVIS